MSEDERPVLPIEVERGVRCYHGTNGACLWIRCGSNCSSRFDRMHPCPACAVRAVRADDEWTENLVRAVEAVFDPDAPAEDVLGNLDVALEDYHTAKKEQG